MWIVRGVISFLLSICGGVIGYEGAAIEAAQGFSMKTRPTSARWFELKRRTDAAMSLAGGISAAFGAPFAGILLPIELGMGGRGLAVALSSLSAFLAIRFLGHSPVFFESSEMASLGALKLAHWQTFVALGVVGGISGLLGVSSIWFIQYAEAGFSHQFRNRIWMSWVTAAVFLVLILFIYNPSLDSPWSLLQNLYTLKYSQNEWVLMFFTRFFGLAIVIAGFGTSGVFWPLFILGNLIGFGVNHWLLGDWLASPLAAGLVGGTAFLSATLGVPFAAAALSYDLSLNFKVLFLALLAAALGQGIRRLLRAQTFLDHELDEQSFSYRNGRSVAILNSLEVKDAMVTDYLEVNESETVVELHERIQTSKYPFLIVVNDQGVFRGLLTVDSIEESWKERLAHILQAKDLLYRSFFRSPVIRVTDKLTATNSVFEQSPCVPVLGDGNRVVGLLFVYSVRLAYDRELARRSFSFVREQKD